MEVLYLYKCLKHHSLIGRCYTHIASLEALHLGSLHQSLTGCVRSVISTPVHHWIYCICVCYTSLSLEGAVSAFATPVPYCKVLYLRLLHQSLIGSCCICVCYTSPSLEGVVSAFATPVPYCKVLYLRLLHQSLIGSCCICVCYTSPSLEGVVSASATPVPHWKVLYLRLIHQSLIEGAVSAFAKPLPYLKVLYLRLHLPVIHKKCCISICYTSPSLEGGVSTFASPRISLKVLCLRLIPFPYWKVLYLRLLLPVIH